ncbi:MAG: TetR family transcriptional regulator [Candidatus Eisenbacteria bacterium]|nr:TetR family transcriptional regulator [Candidatus Eisenbacteria bacterium]
MGPTDRREIILRAARAQFGRCGYAGASMREIAQEARVTKAALYYHFPDKSALFRAATEWALARVQARIERRLAQRRGSRRRLRAVLQAYLQEFARERDLIHRLGAILHLPQGDGAWVGAALRRYETPLRDALRACADEGLLARRRIPELTALLLGGIEHAAVHGQLGGDAPRLDLGLADRFIAEILPGPPSPPPRSAARRARRRAGVARRSKAVRAAAVTWLLPIVGLLTAAPAQEGVPADSPGPIVAVPGAGRAMGVQACVAQALQANSDLQAERTRREELDALRYQAVAIGLPTIDLTGTWSRGRDPSFALDQTFGGGFGGEDDTTTSASPCDSVFACFGGLSFIPAPEDIPAQTFWRASANARWEINPGLIYNAVGAAGLGVRRQDLMVVDTEHRTAESAMRGYYAVLMAGERLAALDAELAARREFLEVTRQRFALGLSTELDTLRAAVSYANLQPQRRSAAQDLRDAGAQLNILMGRDPLTPLALETKVPIERERVPIDPALGRVAERPDIEAFELYTRILRKDRGAKKSQHRPSLSANGSYGYVTRELDELTDTGHDFWSASVSLRIPLFDGFLTKGQIEEAEAAWRRSREELTAAERQAHLEILSLHGDLETARTNLQAAELNLVTAEDAVRQVSLQYELGKAGYLSLLDAQAQRYLARSNLIAARNEVLTLTASLKRALGFSPTRPLDHVAAQVRTRAAGSAGPPDGAQTEE